MQDILSELSTLTNNALFQGAVAPLVGVVLGGFISLATAIWLRRLDERKRTRQAGLRFISIAIKAINDIHSAHKPLMNQINRTGTLFNEELYWQAIVPFVSSRSTAIDVDAEQYEFALSYLGDDIAHQLQELVSLRNTLLSVLEFYSAYRREIADLMDPHSEIEDPTQNPSLMTTTITSEDNTSLLRKVGEIRVLAKDLVSLSREANQYARNATKSINAALDRKFPRKRGNLVNYRLHTDGV